MTDQRGRAPFKETYAMLSRRIELFTALPFERLDQLTIGARLREIGKLDHKLSRA